MRCLTGEPSASGFQTTPVLINIHLITKVIHVQACLCVYDNVGGEGRGSSAVGCLPSTHPTPIPHIPHYHSHIISGQPLQ